MDGTRIVWPRAKEVELETFTVRPPEPGEIVVRTAVSLISPGTERAWLLGMPGTPNTFPMYPGYSAVGRVAEVGPGVEGLEVGDRVLCDGGHGTHSTLSVKRVFPLSETIEDEAAVFSRLCCIGLQGVRKSAIEFGESAAVLGLGLVGILTVQIARAAGAMPVIGADFSQLRRELAATLGADIVLDPSAGESPENRPDVVFDCTGTPEGVNSAIRAAGYRGRVVLLASTRGLTEAVDFYQDVHKKGLAIIGAHNHVRPPEDSSPGYWTLKDDTLVVLRMIEGGRIRVRELVSHRVSPSEALAVYGNLANWAEEILGVVIDWRE
jgi:L-iditol 2-dehydrogenase